MSNRFKVLGGSLAGAFAIHVALVACGSVSPPSPPAGDGGLVDAVADALVDALQHAADAVVDAEVRDAHAGGDGGVPSDGGACSCAPARPEYSFTASVVRDGMTLRPVADFSRATITWGRGDAFGGPAEVNANISVSFYLPDGASIQLSQCDLRTDLAGAAMSRGLRCTGALYRSLDRAADRALAEPADRRKLRTACPQLHHDIDVDGRHLPPVFDGFELIGNYKLVVTRNDCGWSVDVAALGHAKLIMRAAI
jgi:hypothetical protein